MTDGEHDIADQPTRRTRHFEYEGQFWEVCERMVGSYDRRARPRLVFTCEGTIRTVRDFPADWDALSPHELVELSLRT